MHFLVALNCLNNANDLFHLHTRLYRAQQMKETELETEISEQANPDTMSYAA